MDRKKSIGAFGEMIASKYLTKNGYRIIEANYRTPLGEIDIVASFKKTIVFVEVKTRSTSSFGPPYLSITEKKKAHMIRSALYYLNRRDSVNTPWRIDIVSIKLNYVDEADDVEHFKNAVEDPYI